MCEKVTLQLWVCFQYLHTLEKFSLTFSCCGLQHATALVSVCTKVACCCHESTHTLSPPEFTCLGMLILRKVPSHLLTLSVGMEEHQLKELAYTIFFGACGKRSNAEHVQVMRAQLEVSSCTNSPSKHI